MSYVVLERDASLGGQLNAARHPIADYLGVEASDGPTLARLMVAHARSGRGAIIVNDPIARLDLRAKIAFTDTREVKARTIILAMGARPRLLGVPGEVDAGWEPQPPEAAPKGAQVIVVGGGDNAVDAANAAEADGARVQVLVRGPALRARRKLHCKAIYDAHVTAISEREVHARIAGEDKRLPCDVFIRRIGYAPRSELVRDQLQCDAEGFVRVTPEAATSLHGVFAVGDLVTPPHRQSLANAVGQGACAARSAALLSATHI